MLTEISIAVVIVFVVETKVVESREVIVIEQANPQVGESRRRGLPEGPWSKHS